MTTAATRSLAMAADGLTPKSRISIGVMSAPPPAPVMPTRSPTIALPRTMKGSMCTPHQRSGGSHPCAPRLVDAVKLLAGLELLDWLAAHHGRDALRRVPV